MHSMKQWLNRGAPRVLALLVAWAACLGAAPAWAQAPASPATQSLAAPSAPEVGPYICPVSPAVSRASPPSSGSWPCLGLLVSWQVVSSSPSAPPFVVVAVISGTSAAQLQVLKTGGHWFVPGLSEPMQMDVVSQTGPQGCSAVLKVSVQTSPSSFIVRNIARWSLPSSTCGGAQRAQP